MPHKPVLLAETIQCLALEPGQTVVDGTLGRGGHALEILKKIGPQGRLIGMDQDPDAIAQCQEILKDYATQVSFHHTNFTQVTDVLKVLNISEVDAVILDVGTSSNQLEDAARGFSFERSGPLDMRMNPEQKVRASDLVNDLSQFDLENLFWELGEERWSKKFARAIVEARQKRTIETTDELVDVLQSALPHRYRREEGKWSPKAKRHPATKVFQALRIAVNDELKVLEKALPDCWGQLKTNGRMAIIAFHSLEDRIVKNYFRSLKQSKEAELLTKKPITASREEIKDNPRARSAKLRAIKKLV